MDSAKTGEHGNLSDGSSPRVSIKAPAFAKNAKGRATRRYGMQAPFYAGLGDHFVGGEWRADAQHNTLMAITNVGTRATDVLLTLYYNNGKNKYEMERKAEPSDQVRLNLTDLIHNRVADRKGRVLPADLTSGTYDFRDLHPGKGGQLMGSELALDTAQGPRLQPGYAYCCGYTGIAFDADYYDVVVDGTEQMDVMGVNSCTGKWENIDWLFGNWWSGNPSIAQVTSEQAKGVAPGYTDGNAEGWVPEAGDNCPAIEYEPAAPIYVNSVSQSPSSLNMSNGDTGKQISVTVSGPSGTLAFNSGLTSNPDSSQAASVSIPGKNSFTGNGQFTISATPGPPSSPSGIFYGQACINGYCANQGTTINIPPQVLIQMMQAEAGGTNTTAMGADGDVARNRIGSSLFPSDTTYQNTIVAGQFAIGSATTGIEPELDSAVGVFTDAGGNFCSSLAFWTPTPSQWTVVQGAIKSGTTTFPSGTGAPTFGSSWPASEQQILYVSAVGNQGNGAPNFLYLAVRNSSQPAAVGASCAP